MTRLIPDKILFEKKEIRTKTALLCVSLTSHHRCHIADIRATVTSKTNSISFVSSPRATPSLPQTSSVALGLLMTRLPAFPQRRLTLLRRELRQSGNVSLLSLAVSTLTRTEPLISFSTSSASILRHIGSSSFRCCRIHLGRVALLDSSMSNQRLVMATVWIQKHRVRTEGRNLMKF